MTDERFQILERFVRDARRFFDPLTGLFESLCDEQVIAKELDPVSFLGFLGVTEHECAEYVTRKMIAYDESFRNY